MDTQQLVLVGLVAMAGLFEFTNGFHDSANSIATVVATGVLKPRLAVLWAAGFNFLAFFLVGTAVADTIGATVKQSSFSFAVVFAALLGAITFNYLSWHLGLPTSSSHALVGGLVGAGIAAGGLGAIKASSVEKTGLFIVISPVAGLLLGALVMLGLRGLLRTSEVARTEKRFRALQLVSSAAVSIAHGGNDAQKTMGVVAALLVSSGHLTAGAGGKLPIPDWVAIGCYVAIAIGTLSGGWRIVRMMGTSITRLRPVSGFAAETSAAVAIISSTLIGAPVSTTHTVAGAITGVGTTNRGASVDWKVFGKLVVAWVVTMPIAAAIAAVAWELTTRPAPVVAGVVMTAIVLALIVLLGIALRHAPKASDMRTDDQIDAERDPEREYPLRAGGGSVGPGGPTPAVTPGAHPAAVADRQRAAVGSEPL